MVFDLQGVAPVDGNELDRLGGRDGARVEKGYGDPEFSGRNGKGRERGAGGVGVGLLIVPRGHDIVRHGSGMAPQSAHCGDSEGEDDVLAKDPLAPENFICKKVQ